ncbi:MAG: Uma2 family endonuclease [Planctomycetes bacterium]|nr:Uma2 family endonuclease [Planctomycetota bacterium]
MYARAGIPVYWIINLVQGRVEVYESPGGDVNSPAYERHAAYTAGDLVPFAIAGRLASSIPVAELLP